jgi:RNA polymerase sigma-70 factor (ECF subfamily)
MAGINQIEFDQIFEEWYNPVRNFIYYKSGDLQIAEDITQDAFLKIWEKRESIKILTVKSLLYKIAGNMFLNRQEHKKVLFKFINDYQVNEFSDAPDYELEMKEFDEKNRVVFLMNRIDDLTYNEIAMNMGLSVKAVEKRMGKALSFLKEKLDVKI